MRSLLAFPKFARGADFITKASATALYVAEEATEGNTSAAPAIRSSETLARRLLLSAARLSPDMRRKIVPSPRMWTRAPEAH